VGPLLSNTSEQSDDVQQSGCRRSGDTVRAPRGTGTTAPASPRTGTPSPVRHREEPRNGEHEDRAADPAASPGARMPALVRSPPHRRPRFRPPGADAPQKPTHISSHRSGTLPQYARTARAGPHGHRERLRLPRPSGRSRRTRRALGTHRSTEHARLSADGGGRVHRRTFIARGLTGGREAVEGTARTWRKSRTDGSSSAQDVNPPVGGCRQRRKPALPPRPLRTNSVRCHPSPSSFPERSKHVMARSISLPRRSADDTRLASRADPPLLRTGQPGRPRPHGSATQPRPEPDPNSARPRSGDPDAVSRLLPGRRSIHRLSRKATEHTDNDRPPCTTP